MGKSPLPPRPPEAPELWLGHCWNLEQNRNVSRRWEQGGERTLPENPSRKGAADKHPQGSKPAEPQARRLLAGLLFPLSDPVLRRHQSTGVTSASQFAWDALDSSARALRTVRWVSLGEPGRMAGSASRSAAAGPCVQGCRDCCGQGSSGPHWLSSHDPTRQLNSPVSAAALSSVFTEPLVTHSQIQHSLLASCGQGFIALGLPPKTSCSEQWSPSLGTYENPLRDWTSVPFKAPRSF